MIRRIKAVKDAEENYNELTGRPEDSDNNLVGIRLYSGIGAEVNDPVYIFANEIDDDVLARASILDKHCNWYNEDEVCSSEDLDNEEDFFNNTEAYERALNSDLIDNADFVLFDKDGFEIGASDTWVYLDRSSYGKPNGFLFIEQIKTTNEKRDPKNELQNKFFEGLK